jgi:hypothetical protein
MAVRSVVHMHRMKLSKRLIAAGLAAPPGDPLQLAEESRAAADEHMQFIAANRDRVRAYFQDLIVKYAA